MGRQGVTVLVKAAPQRGRIYSVFHVCCHECGCVAAAGTAGITTTRTPEETLINALWRRVRLVPGKRHPTVWVCASCLSKVFYGTDDEARIICPRANVARTTPERDPSPFD